MMTLYGIQKLLRVNESMSVSFGDDDYNGVMKIKRVSTGLIIEININNNNDHIYYTRKFYAQVLKPKNINSYYWIPLNGCIAQDIPFNKWCEKMVGYSFGINDFKKENN